MKFNFLTILLLLISQNIFATNCQNPAQGFTCNYYRECLDSELECGRSGYPIGYGEKYCNKFFELDRLGPDKELSTEGKKWRKVTGICLQVELQKGLMNNSFYTCNQLTKYAFDSHPNCYTQKEASICELTLKDWIIIANLPDLKDLISIKGGKQMTKVMKTCSKQIVIELAELKMANSRYGLGTRVHLNSIRESVLTAKLNFLNNLK